MAVVIRAGQGPELARVAVALRTTEAGLPARLRAEVENAANVLTAQARARVIALPARGAHGSTGLRRRVAAGIRIEGAGPMGVRVVTSMADPREAIIPRGLDSGDKGWRHPVFGNSDVWVTQQGYSWFRDTMAAGRPALEARLFAVLQGAAATIAAAGLPGPR